VILYSCRVEEEKLFFSTSSSFVNACLSTKIYLKWNFAGQSLLFLITKTTKTITTIATTIAAANTGIGLENSGTEEPKMLVSIMLYE
jgi:hypothetical protein